MSSCISGTKNPPVPDRSFLFIISKFPNLYKTYAFVYILPKSSYDMKKGSRPAAFFLGEGISSNWGVAKTI